MHPAGPAWLSPAQEDRLIERFPRLSRLDLRSAARLLDEGATPVELIISSLERAAGGRDGARQVLAQLRVARERHGAGPAGGASDHL